MPAQLSVFTYELPARLYTNADFLADFPDTKLESLEKIGVKERHITPQGQTSSDLAVAAAEKLFHLHQIDRTIIDFVIYCSRDMDYYTPATACVIQHRLGLGHHCGAFDMTQGCSGYIYGLATACGLIETLNIRNVLLLTASSLTHQIHPKDRANRFLFGDAATASLIVQSPEKSIGPFVLGTDGSGSTHIIVPHGGMRHPITTESFKEETDEFGNTTSPAHFHMDGSAVFRFTLRQVPQLVHDMLNKANLDLNDIDLFVFHQPNVFLNEAIRKKLGISNEKFVHCMDRFGNTVQGTIPIALTEALHQGRLHSGMRVLLAGFGVGLSWGACIINY